MSRSQRRAMIDREEPKLSLVRQSALLGISRSSLYYLPTEAGAEDLELMALIDQQYLKTPFYGSRRMTASGSRSRHHVNRNLVRWLKQLIGTLEAIYRRLDTSNETQGIRSILYLVINWTSNSGQPGVGHRPHLACTWLGVSYDRVAIMDGTAATCGLAAVQDPGGQTSSVAALDEALSKGRPQICNTDHASQITSEACRSMLLSQPPFQVTMAAGAGAWTTSSWNGSGAASRYEASVPEGIPQNSD